MCGRCVCVHLVLQPAHFRSALLPSPTRRAHTHSPLPYTSPSPVMLTSLASHYLIHILSPRSRRSFCSVSHTYTPPTPIRACYSDLCVFLPILLRCQQAQEEARQLKEAVKAEKEVHRLESLKRETDHARLEQQRRKAATGSREPVGTGDSGVPASDALQTVPRGKSMNTIRAASTASQPTTTSSAARSKCTFLGNCTCPDCAD